MSYWIKTEYGDLFNLENIKTISIGGKEKKGKKEVGVYADDVEIKMFETRQEAEKLVDLLFEKLCGVTPSDVLNFEEKKEE